MIFHAKKPNGFVMIDKAALNDNRISLKAKGLLCYLLSKPPDWRPQIEDICFHCTERARAVRSAFKELAKFGYAKLMREGSGKGRWEGSFWAIYESPPSAEIAVLRNSEKRNLKLIRIRGNKNERVLSEIVLKKLDGYKEPDRETLLKENEGLIQQLLVGHVGDDFLKQWRTRSEKSPWRTQYALAELYEEIVSGAKIRNRGGKANWWYLNCDKRKGFNGINKP